MIRKILRRKKGFTLIEMVVVIFILGLLIMLIMPNINKQRKNAENTSQAAFERVLHSQAELYVATEKGAGINPDTVSIQELVAANYLTPKQKERADKLRISTINLNDDSNKDNGSHT